MNVGSIVIMVNPIDNYAKKVLLSMGINEWPEPCDNPLQVVGISKDRNLINGVGIAVDLYPKLRENGILMDISLFRELLPPEEVDMVEIMKIQEPVTT